jgi:hypothetical protein
VLTQASMMLTVGGGESYTHPVQRGRWVMSALLCASPPAPPPGVPTLDMSASSNLPMKARLNQHVNTPNCIGCHATMDVYGLGLENFDLQGKWRDTYPELGPAPIDASGTLPDGRSFKDPAEMIDLLAADPNVKDCLARKLMAYVLTRPTDSMDDQCVGKVIGEGYATADSHLSDLFSHIAESPQFLTQQGVAP